MSNMSKYGTRWIYSLYVDSFVCRYICKYMIPHIELHKRGESTHASEVSNSRLRKGKLLVVF